MFRRFRIAEWLTFALVLASAAGTRSDPISSSVNGITVTQLASGQGAGGTPSVNAQGQVTWRVEERWGRIGARRQKHS